VKRQVSTRGIEFEQLFVGFNNVLDDINTTNRTSIMERNETLVVGKCVAGFAAAISLMVPSDASEAREAGLFHLAQHFHELDVATLVELQEKLPPLDSRNLLQDSKE
jgi:hypothetical protein